jgi:hypothetical protein
VVLCFTKSPTFTDHLQITASSYSAWWKAIRPEYTAPPNVWICVIDGFINLEDNANSILAKSIAVAKLYQITDLH